MGNGSLFSSVPEVKTELNLFASIHLRMVKPKTNAKPSSTLLTVTIKLKQFEFTDHFMEEKESDQII